MFQTSKNHLVFDDLSTTGFAFGHLSKISGILLFDYNAVNRYYESKIYIIRPIGHSEQGRCGAAEPSA